MKFLLLGQTWLLFTTALATTVLESSSESVIYARVNSLFSVSHPPVIPAKAGIHNELAVSDE